MVIGTANQPTGFHIHLQQVADRAVCLTLAPDLAWPVPEAPLPPSARCPATMWHEPGFLPPRQHRPWSSGGACDCLEKHLQSDSELAIPHIRQAADGRPLADIPGSS
jgi:hypothetical protein